MKIFLKFLLLVTVFATSIQAYGSDELKPVRSFKGPLGLQLYSLREDFAKDIPGTLDKVRDMGFRYVELAGTYNLAPETFRSMLDERGLEAVANLIPYERFRDEMAGVVNEAVALGVKFIGCAWIPHQAPFDLKQANAAIEVFNLAGKQLKPHGIKFYYHFHGFEFQPDGDETLADRMIRGTNRKWVDFEMDVFWIKHAGQDPVALLKKHGKRWTLMHAKDIRVGVKTGILTGQSDVKNDVILGTGQSRWPEIMEAAQKVGLKYYFIEDESPWSAKQIPESAQYLLKLKW